MRGSEGRKGIKPYQFPFHGLVEGVVSNIGEPSLRVTTQALLRILVQETFENLNKQPRIVNQQLI